MIEYRKIAERRNKYNVFIKRMIQLMITFVSYYSLINLLSIGFFMENNFFKAKYTIYYISIYKYSEKLFAI